MGNSKIVSKRTLNASMYDFTIKELREFIAPFTEADDNNKVSVTVNHGDRPGELSQISISADITFQLTKISYPALVPNIVRSVPPYSINETVKPSEKSSDYIGPYGSGVQFGD